MSNNLRVNRDEVHAAVKDEREALVADLERVAPPDWERESLCDGWLVRDVVGHLVRLDSVYRYSAPFFVGLVRYGLRVNTYIREDARRFAKEKDPASLLAALAATRYDATVTAALHPIPAVFLSEVVLHGQDIRVPLGIERSFEVERLVPIANLLKRRLGVFGRGGRPSGRFEATDADWGWGSGDVMRAPMQSIVMRLAGRDG
jgi:uncharacterized protein (TIGR03083 family)